MVPFHFSKLLSYLGAFYIKRQIDTKKDQLYWSILSSYIKNSIQGGHHIEFFLEGARTRSGKCCVPKGLFIEQNNDHFVLYV